jgi:hypothetical protein
MWTSLKYIRPDQVQKMGESFLMTETSDTDSEMLDDRSSSLSVNVISVGQRVFQQADDRMNVILGHLPHIFENERERFEATVTDVQLWRAVLIEDGRNAGERTTGLSDDSCENEN